MTPSPEQWTRAAWAEVLAQFLVVARASQKPIGLVAVYRPNFQDGHAYLSGARFDAGKRSPLMIMGVSLFLKYVFECWDFRKIYMDVPEFNLTPIASGLSRHYFTLEGQLKEHVFFEGRYWDQYTLAAYRDVWAHRGGRLRVEGD